MIWQRVEGNWDSLKLKIQSNWIEITDEDLDHIAGKREWLLGDLQGRTGQSAEEIEAELERLCLA